MGVLSLCGEGGERLGVEIKGNKKARGVGRAHNTHPTYCSHLSSHSRRAADLWSTEDSSLGFTISGGLSILSHYLLLPSLFYMWSETVDNALKLPSRVSKFGIFENLLCILHDTVYNYSCKNMSQKTEQEGTEMKSSKASQFIAACLTGFYSEFLPDRL